MILCLLFLQPIFFPWRKDQKELLSCPSLTCAAVLDGCHLRHQRTIQSKIKKTIQSKIAKKNGVVQPKPLDTWQLPQPIAAAQLYWSALARHKLNLQFGAKNNHWNTVILLPIRISTIKRQAII